MNRSSRPRIIIEFNYFDFGPKLKVGRKIIKTYKAFKKKQWKMDGPRKIGPKIKRGVAGPNQQEPIHGCWSSVVRCMGNKSSTQNWIQCNAGTHTPAPSCDGLWSSAGDKAGTHKGLTVSRAEKKANHQCPKGWWQSEAHTGLRCGSKENKSSRARVWTKKYPSNARCVHWDWGPVSPLQAAVFWSGSSGWDDGSSENHHLVAEGWPRR